jgi:hypothetical protein
MRGVCEPVSTIEISETGFGASTTGLPANLGNTPSYPAAIKVEESFGLAPVSVL